MRIVIIGPPDSGKRELAKKLKKKYKGISLSDSPEDFYISLFKSEEKAPAVGFLSDYRSELFLASYRACDMMMNDDKIFTHTVLDSMSYILTILSIKIQNESLTNEWADCFTFFPSLIRDSFKSDVVIRMPYVVDEDNDLTTVFNSSQDFILDTFDIKYIEYKSFNETCKIIDSLKNESN